MATCLLHVFLDIDINAIHSALLKTSNGFLSSIQDDAFSGQYLGKHFLRCVAMYTKFCITFCNFWIVFLC